MAVEGFFEPLPEAEGEFPVRRGKFIDVEVYGNLFAATGTFTSVTIDDATITDATISGTTTINDAILTNVTIQADLKSSNWNGASDDLSGGAVVATTGYLLDYSAGAAQFQNIYAEGGDLGALNVTDTLTMGAGGAIRTAATGQRISITNTDKNLIKFYSGDPDEIITGSIAQATNGAGVTRTIQFGTFTPKIEHTVATQVDAGGSFVVRSGSPDGTSFAPGFVFAQSSAASGGGQDLEIRIQNDIPIKTSGDIYLGNSQTVQIYEPSANVFGVAISGTRRFSVSANAVLAGDAATTGAALMETSSPDAGTPAYSFYNDDDTGLYRAAANTVAIAAGGSRQLSVSTSAVVVGNLDTGGALMEIGDPTNPAFPAYSFYGDDNTGMYRSAADTIRFATNGVGRLQINDTRVSAFGVDFLRVPVKATTGDPSSPGDGDVYVNTFDNKMRVYADGAWRDIVTW